MEDRFVGLYWSTHFCCYDVRRTRGLQTLFLNGKFSLNTLFIQVLHLRNECGPVAELKTFTLNFLQPGFIPWANECIHESLMRFERIK